MTGEELKELRHDLGRAIDRRLSLADMAQICGLKPDNGADTIRKWEAGPGPSGPVTVLLELVASSYRTSCDPAVTEFFDQWLISRLNSPEHVEQSGGE